MLQVDGRAEPGSVSPRESYFKRFLWLIVSAVLLIEVGIFKPVFVEAAGDGGYKALVVCALAAFLLSLVSTALRIITKP